MEIQVGKQSLAFAEAPYIISSASIVGKKEGEGPLGNRFDVVGEDVLVTGAGPIGIMAAAICKKNGARQVIITDMNEYRLELARKMGLFAINIGAYDDVEVKDALKVEAAMQDYMKINHADLIDRIEQQKALSKEDEQLLTEAVKEFKKSGAF